MGLSRLPEKMPGCGQNLGTHQMGFAGKDAWVWLKLRSTLNGVKSLCQKGSWVWPKHKRALNRGYTR